MGFCLISELEKMSNQELKRYLAIHRDDQFSAALQELISRRDQDAKMHPADLPSEELGQVFEEKISEINQSK